jgi:hypothetical protein
MQRAPARMHVHSAPHTACALPLPGDPPPRRLTPAFRVRVEALFRGPLECPVTVKAYVVDHKAAAAIQE